MKTEEQISSSCHMAFISMALGIFVLVCSAVIAGTLLSTALSNKLAAEELEKKFSTYEDLGNIMFALGDELVSSVDVSLSKDAAVENMVIAQKITNKVLSQVKDQLAKRWLTTDHYILNEVEDRIAFRELISWGEPMPAIKTYVALSEWILKNSLDTDYGSRVTSEVAPYILFVKGMAQHFGEMAMGILYAKTDSYINGLDLVSLSIGSRESMTLAFSFEPQAVLKLQELQTRAQNITYMIIEDVTTRSLRNNGHFSILYSTAVKEETAGLFLAKEILNNTLHSKVKDTADKAGKNLYFNMTIVIVSVAAMILCFIFSLISRATTRGPIETTGSRDLIYHHL